MAKAAQQPEPEKADEVERVSQGTVAALPRGEIENEARGNGASIDGAVEGGIPASFP